MFKYKIKIPLFVEQKSNFDKHDFSSNTNICFFIEKEYNHMNFVLKGEDGDYTIKLWNLIFNNLDECIYSIEISLKKLLPICSLLIQNQYSNQHYTHLRLDYNISKANILENIMIQQKEEKNMME